MSSAVAYRRIFMQSLWDILPGNEITTLHKSELFLIIEIQIYGRMISFWTGIFSMLTEAGESKAVQYKDLAGTIRRSVSHERLAIYELDFKFCKHHTNRSHAHVLSRVSWNAPREFWVWNRHLSKALQGVWKQNANFYSPSRNSEFLSIVIIIGI